MINYYKYTYSKKKFFKKKVKDPSHTNRSIEHMGPASIFVYTRCHSVGDVVNIRPADIAFLGSLSSSQNRLGQPGRSHYFFFLICIV